MNTKDPSLTPPQGETPQQRQQAERAILQRPSLYPGYNSNAIITRRNGGVAHQFADSIGGCSANYK